MASPRGGALSFKFNVLEESATPKGFASFQGFSCGVVALFSDGDFGPPTEMGLLDA